MHKIDWVTPFTNLANVSCDYLTWRNGTLELQIGHYLDTGLRKTYQVPNTKVEINDGIDWRVGKKWRVLFKGGVEAFRITNENNDESLRDRVNLGYGSAIRTAAHSKSSWLNKFEYAKHSGRDLKHFVIYLDDLNYYEIISEWLPEIEEVNE
jgi:hypothetical protein